MDQMGGHTQSAATKEASPVAEVPAVEELEVDALTGASTGAGATKGTGVGAGVMGVCSTKGAKVGAGATKGAKVGAGTIKGANVGGLVASSDATSSDSSEAG